MAAETVLISLGSNKGKREDNLLEAVAVLSSLPGVEIKRLSPLFETDPVGEGFSTPFVNAVVVLETVMEPESMLAACQEAERRLGRDAGARGGDRTIDIDIIDFGGRILDTADLVLPHPRASRRAFVLEPLRSLDPGFIFPDDDRTVSDIIGEGMPKGGVRKISTRKEIPIELLE